MKVHVLKYSKAELAALPASERRLLFMLGHATNEINVLQRLLLMIRPSEARSKIEKTMDTAQALIVMRMLIGKVHEACELYRIRVISDKAMAAKYHAALDEERKESYREINRLIGQNSTLATIRNNLSFHYADKQNKLESAFQSLPEAEEWVFYLSQMVGNSFYYAAELVVSGAAVAAVPQPKDEPPLSTEARFDALYDLVLGVCSHITGIFNHLLVKILEPTLLDNRWEAVDIGNAPKMSESRLPFFFDEDDLRTMNKG